MGGGGGFFWTKVELFAYMAIVVDCGLQERMNIITICD